MQPIKMLSQWLVNNTNHEHYLFTLFDMRSLFPQLSDSAFKTLMSRAVRSELLTRLCRGIYLYKSALPKDGLLLYHIAALLRADNFNYISLETVLSDAGVISQIPLLINFMLNLVNTLLQFNDAILSFYGFLDAVKLPA